MTLLKIAFLLSLPTLAVAQGFTPVAVTARGTDAAAITASYSGRTTNGLAVADTGRARQHSIAPFLVFGAILGGVVGAVLAESWGCGEAQLYVSCSGTSAIDGAMLGSMVGAAGGFLAWVISAPPKPAPPVK